MSFAPDAARRVRLVFVRGLALQARLGVHPHEKAAPQRVVIHVELAVEDDAAPDRVGADDLRRVVNYGEVVRAARAAVAEGIPCWWKLWRNESPWRGSVIPGCCAPA
ncbi:dihydroneopterin aldolase [Siccirubricoccus deserti]